MNETNAHIVEARPPNWLPIPCEEEKPKQRIQAVDENDFFRKGDLDSFYPNQGYGIINDRHAGQIQFSISDIMVIGDSSHLGSGVRVGYDISRTSLGPRITKLKIY